MSMTMSSFVTGTVLNKKVVGAGNATVRVAALIVDHVVHEAVILYARCIESPWPMIMHRLIPCRLVPRSGPTRPCVGP